MLSKYRVDTRAGKIYNKKTKKEVANSFDIRGSIVTGKQIGRAHV